MANARETARLLALAAMHRLFDRDARACDDMILMMRKRVDQGNVSFIADALTAGGISVYKVSSKIGIGVSSHEVPGSSGAHDCAIIKRMKGAKQLRYVAVVIGGYTSAHEGVPWDQLARALDKCVADAH